MAKGRFSEAAAKEFKKQLGIAPEEWHYRWNEDNPSREGGGEPVIPGRFGQLYPYCKLRVGVYVKGPRKIGQARRIWGEPYQDADNEANFVVRLDEMNRAAELIKAYRRKRMRQDPILPQGPEPESENFAFMATIAV